MENVVSVEVEARQAAEDEVAHLLVVPNDLKRLPAYREDQARQQKVVRASLSATIAHQVESIRSGLELLDKAQKAILKMKEAFVNIDTLCAECNNIIRHHDKIQQLAAVHYNITKTLQYAEHVAALPQQAQQAEDLLSDESQLLQVYEMLSVLECTSIKAQKALEAGAKMSVSEMTNLNTYFVKVRQSFNRFEERLWSIIRNFMNCAVNEPWLLTNAVQVIETQELVDKQLLGAMEVALDPVVKPKYYRTRAHQQIAMCLEEKFAPLQQKCSKLAGAGENTKERVNEILSEAWDYVEELTVIYDNVAPCFPPDYKIFDVIRSEYHKQIASMLDFIGVCSDNLANSDILDVIGWVERYMDSLENLGVEENGAELPDGATNGMPLLISKYMERTKAILQKWYSNILKDDMEHEPKETAEGHAYTPGVTDFFRILNEQLSLLEPVSRGQFLLSIAQVLLEVMVDYQDLQREYIRRQPMNDENDMFLIAAVANNSQRCFFLALDFKDDLENMLAEELKGKLVMDKEVHGFVGLTYFCLGWLVDGMFKIPLFAALFRQLYCSEDWRSGSTTNSITATLDEWFFGSCSYWLEPRSFERLAVMTLERTVLHYLAAALNNIKVVDEDIVAGMQNDISAIDGFFGATVKPDQVASEIQQLVDLRALLAADNVDSFLLSYTSLLQACPGISPAIVERLIYARQDLSKGEVRQIIEQCREVYIDRQRALTPEEASKLIKPSSKETGFERALLAARRVGSDNFQSSVMT